MFLVFLRVFGSLWLELSNKYHEDAKTRRNTKNLAKKARNYDLVMRRGQDQVDLVPREVAVRRRARERVRWFWAGFDFGALPDAARLVRDDFRIMVAASKKRKYGLP